MKPSKLLAGAVALSSLAAAWTEVLDRSNGVSRVENVLYARQENNDNSDNNNNDNKDNKDEESEAPKETAAPKTSAKGEEKQEASATGDKDDAPKETGDAKETGKDSDNKSQSASGSGTGKATGTGTGKSKPTFTGEPEFDPRLPEGGAAMITPGPLDPAQYYKIGDFVTFAWNYTSVSKMPKAIDVIVTARANPDATYTLAANMSGGGTPTVVWDTKAEKTKEGSAPFLSDMYTLVVHDAAIDPASATPKPGYFQVFNQFTFGMYLPRDPVPWKDYTCANCLPKNGGLSLHEKQSLTIMMVTCGTTFASTLYFLHSFGLL